MLYHSSMTAEQTALVEDYLPMVKGIARQLCQKLHFFDFEELVSEGYVGLCQAAIRYDFENAAHFRTFAYYRVYGAMVDYTRRQRRGIQRSKEQDKFTMVSFETPITESLTVEDTLVAEEIFSYDYFSVFSCLSERDAVIMFRYVFLNDRQQEIADDYGITESRINQIIARARKRMKAFI
jgi:RNA polymerase sigma factor (sigma-70 family)